MGAYFHGQFKFDIIKIMRLFLIWTFAVCYLMFYCCTYSRVQYFESLICITIYGLLPYYLCVTLTRILIILLCSLCWSFCVIFKNPRRMLL